MLQEILDKFGHPVNTVKEYDHWIVLARQNQVTLGSLILICKDDATAFSKISPEAFAQLPQVISDIETVLAQLFVYDKINYLMLMMVDPDVHFHIIPRYGRNVRFADFDFKDSGWPGEPAMKIVNEIDDTTRGAVITALRDGFHALM
jgi:diadenosine tetraphosphate (Ap4A) HIT family hydrolase